MSNVQGQGAPELGRITELAVLKFAQARAHELAALSESIAARSGGKRVFQKIPRYMRRRAMSYNIHLLPRRLRGRAQSEINKNLTSNLGAGEQTASVAKNFASKFSKKTKKKYKLKRRVIRLAKIRQSQLSTNTDQLKRLDTHVWHAKRFALTKLWGYYLPLKSHQKIFRPTYRFTAQQCSIYDASYQYVVELSGSQSRIIQMLKLLNNGEHIATTNNKDYQRNNSDFSKRVYLDGSRASEFMMYQPVSNNNASGLPRRCIGPVPFLWQQHESIYASPELLKTTSDIQRKIWLWIHPAAYIDALEALKAAASMVNEGVESPEGQVKINEDKIRDFARFELRGPRANLILHKTFKLADCIHNTTNPVGRRSKRFCFKKLKQLRTSASLPNGVVLVVTVNNTFSTRKHAIATSTTATTTTTNSTTRSSNAPMDTRVAAAIGGDEILEIMSQWPQGLALADSLWSAPSSLTPAKQLEDGEDGAEEMEIEGGDGGKDKAGNKKNQKQTQRRTSAVFVAEDNDTFEVMLIQRPSHLSRGFGSGWDLVVKRAYSARVWNALNRAGGILPIGLDDRNRMMNEQGIASFPFDYPDTDACKITQIQQQLLQREQKSEPSKKKRPKQQPQQQGNKVKEAKAKASKASNKDDATTITSAITEAASAMVIDNDSDNKLESIFDNSNLLVERFITFTNAMTQRDRSGRASNTNTNGINAQQRVVVAVSLLFHGKGVAPHNMPNAKIYAFPTRKERLEFEKAKNQLKNCKLSKFNSEQEAAKKAKAAALENLEKQYLIGYVSRGFLSLIRGKPFAIGFCDLAKAGRLFSGHSADDSGVINEEEEYNDDEEDDSYSRYYAWNQVFVENAATEKAQKHTVLRPARISLLQHH